MKRRMALLMSIILVISCLNIGITRVYADSDTTAPVVNSVSFDQEVVHAGNTISVTVIVEDDSDIKLDNSSYVTIGLGNNVLIPIYLTEQDGNILHGSIETDSSWSNGGYLIAFIWIEDEFGNVNDTNSYINRRVTVLDGVSEDYNLTINSIGIDKTDVTNGDTVTFTLSCQNMAISDPSLPKIVLKNDSDEFSNREVSLVLQEDGSYVGTIDIDDTWFEGEYYIERLIARKKTRANVEYTNYQDYKIYVTGAAGFCDHSDISVITKRKSTCSKTGLCYKKCNICGCIIEDNIVIETEPHNEVKDVDVNATCTEVGHTGGSHCSVCKTIIKEQTEIPALGHTEEIISEVAATCTEDGKTAGKKCSVCGEILVPQESISAYGHKWISVTVLKSATCTEVGRKLYKCKTCGEYKYEDIPATGHKYSTTGTIAKSATCTEIGQKRYKCINCSDYISEDIPALGHNFSTTGTIEKSATCVEVGIKKYKCTRCNEYDYEEIPAKGHYYSSVGTVIKNATCTEIGQKKFKCLYCSDCIYEDIPALGHNCNKSETIKATCTEKGLIKYKCSRCEYTYSEDIPALGHDYSKYATIVKEATCFEMGIKRYYCTRCSSFEKEESIPMKEHSYKYYSKTVKEATCTQNGEKRYECYYCDSYKSEVIPALGHSSSFASTIREATCTEKGLKSSYCYRCGKYEYFDIPAKGHKTYYRDVDLPSNNSVGHESGEYCYECGKYLSGGREIPKTIYKLEWVNGKWYDKYGRIEKNSKCAWHCNSSGWWFTGSNNKYFSDVWIKIEHKWYYFKPDGYMAQNEWFGGYWFSSSGTWTYNATMDWHCDSNGWWIQDSSGWYPRNQWQKIDGVWRYFNGSGYMVTNQYVDGYWLTWEGRYY